MSGFSSILDITSFFIGVLVNLLLVAMICFYFKRKIDTLEVAQSEQAKILFELVQNNQPSISEQMNELTSGSTYGMLNNLDLTDACVVNDSETNVNKDSEESDSDDSDDSDGSDDSDDENNESETKKIEYENNEIHPSFSDESIEKLTIKELRALLESNGVSVTKKNIKKKELLDLVSVNNIKKNVDESHDEIKLETSNENIESINTSDLEVVEFTSSNPMDK